MTDKYTPDMVTGDMIEAHEARPTIGQAIAAAINESPLWREVLHLRAEVNELTEKCKELALDASACEVMCDQARSERDRAIAACERQAASHESTVAMLRAGQERTRLILREGLHACLGPRCLCKTGDCAKSDACPYGRTTIKETTP